MSKKILAVILTLVMVLSMVTGCGKKDSTYFKEVKEMCKITTGTQTVEMNVTYKGDDSEEIPAVLLDAEAKMALSIKMEATVESNTKTAIKILAKLGTDSDYSELTTMIVNDKVLYLAVDPVLDFVSKIDATTATELETSLASMGIAGNVSIDMGQLLEAMGMEYPTVTDDMAKSGYELVEDFMAALEKNFSDLAGQDGDDYTLTVNAENAEAAVTGLSNFCKNDVKGLVEKVNTLMADMYGEDNVIYTSAKESYDELANSAADAATSIEESKEDVVKTFKDYKLNIVSKASVSGSEGKREAKFSVETGDITVDGATINMNIKSDMKEGKPSISEMIPEDAADLTTMLVALMNQMGGLSGTDTEGVQEDFGMTVE